MCFGGSPKMPDTQPAPTPAPPPTITPSDVSPQSQEQNRVAAINRMRLGMASTIKTPLGMTGNKADLAPAPTGKTYLG